VDEEEDVVWFINWLLYRLLSFAFLLKQRDGYGDTAEQTLACALGWAFEAIDITSGIDAFGYWVAWLVA
jgi:hypothetical protein